MAGRGVRTPARRVGMDVLVRVEFRGCYRRHDLHDHQLVVFGRGLRVWRLMKALVNVLMVLSDKRCVFAY